MEQPPFGQQEWEVWRYIADHAPVTGRAVVEHFAAARGLARTTVLTVIERLRRKEYLTRRRRDGVFHYWPRVPVAEVTQSVIRRFVERTLGGSVSPLLSFLGQPGQITEEELAELQRLVETLKSRKDETAG